MYYTFTFYSYCTKLVGCTTHKRQSSLAPLIEAQQGGLQLQPKVDLAIYLHQLCYLWRSLEHYPVIHGNGVLVSVPPHSYVSPKEEQGEGRDERGIVQEHCRALHLGVVDHVLAAEERLITVDRLGVELDLAILGVELRIAGGV